MDELQIISSISPQTLGILIFGIVIFVAAVLLGLSVKEKVNTPVTKIPSFYKKKEYLFDSISEFNLHKTLVELFSDRFYIFSQIQYSHLVEPKPDLWWEMRRHRSRIDRKSADFVLCDKERVVPQLVIELDGSSHELERKQERDQFINETMEAVGLPILHLYTNRLNKDYVKEEVERILSQKTS